MAEDQIPQEDLLAKTSLHLGCTGGTWWVLGSGAGSVLVQVRASALADSKSLMVQGTELRLKCRDKTLLKNSPATLTFKKMTEQVL